MNTGMQDAFNLAWKLALVDRGQAQAEILLDSYSSERGKVAELVLAGTASPPTCHAAQPVGSVRPQSHGQPAGFVQLRARQDPRPAR